MSFIIVFIIWIAVVSFIGYMSLNTIRRAHPSQIGSFKEVSHEWHATEGEIGDEHVDRIGREPIKHEAPELGYVILNGRKHRIEDCRNL